jgi:hypothetical protein
MLQIEIFLSEKKNIYQNKIFFSNPKPALHHSPNRLFSTLQLKSKKRNTFRLTKGRLNFFKITSFHLNIDRSVLLFGSLVFDSFLERRAVPVLFLVNHKFKMGG